MELEEVVLRGQLQVLVSSMALALTVAVIALLFTSIYAYTSNYRIVVRGGNVYDVLREKPYWSACSLADELLTRLNAIQVSVNITEYKLTGGVSLVRSENCTASVESRSGSGYTLSYVYSIGTIYGTVIKYGVRVIY
ncbi:hypothetical protein DKAM_0169 [Desulfurococcus amylolyticus 1221n]|uniref:Uncharacterized protein n=1 Tax=Desulfurococcus amylolyticus (strain DSM 18924 / JCM 16383 / VKM B-2413 / 1221n) TaxID=490899 RepID=B8D2V1_DESA1|nr:hypothetical protein [Desulfurococcus amylolyticus]ACL10498.1 hypothetical protein DKAM_0169 [Desulfurococcus amylolyticus 1221n]